MKNNVKEDYDNICLLMLPGGDPANLYTDDAIDDGAVAISKISNPVEGFKGEL